MTLAGLLTCLQEEICLGVRKGRSLRLLSAVPLERTLVLGRLSVLGGGRSSRWIFNIDVRAQMELLGE